MFRVEYTISFENYLEMTAAGAVKTDYVIPFIFALVGFFLLACGSLWFYIKPSSGSFVGGTLLACGLLVTILALPAAAFARPRPGTAKTDELRRVYARYHSDPRVLEVDEEGWTVHWRGGVDTRPWPVLKAIHNMKTLIVLATDSTPYWLPKEALEREGQLKPLLHLAQASLRKRELVCTVPACPSALVYSEAMLFHNLRRAVKTRLLAYAAVMLMVYWFGFGNPEYPKMGSPSIVLFVPVVLIVFEGLYYIQKFFQSYRKAVSKQAEIMVDCILYENEKVSWIAKYSGFTEVREIPGALLLYANPETFHLIPKKGFSGEQLQRFKELLGAGMVESAAASSMTR